MSQELTLAELDPLFWRAGEQLEKQTALLYLIGSMALHFLGNPRPTFGLDYVGADLPGGRQARQVEQATKRVKERASRQT